MRRLALAGAAMTFVLSCAPTDTGNPPAAFDVFPEEIGIEVFMGITRTEHRIVAGPGAVVPAEGSVVVLNVDRVAAPTSAEIQADGSFVVEGLSDLPELHRLWVEGAGGRSDPIDIVLGAVEELDPVELALPPCVTLESAPIVDLDETAVATRAEAVLGIDNACASGVNVDLELLGQEPTVFSLEGASSVVSGERESITMTATAPTEGRFFETLNLRTSAPMEGRAVVTFITSAR